MSKTIFRNKKKKNYTVIGNQLINTPELSWKAKGMLIYLLSKPEDWVTRLEDIVKHSTDGRAAVLSGIKELKQKGYLEKVRVTDPKTGQVSHWETIVHEEPMPTTPDVENRHSGNPDCGFPESGKSNTTKYGSNKGTKEQITTFTHTHNTEKTANAGVCVDQSDSFLNPLDETPRIDLPTQPKEPTLSKLDKKPKPKKPSGSSESANLAHKFVEYANDIGWSLKATKGLVRSCEGKSWDDLLNALRAMCEQSESEEGVKHQQRYFSRAISEGWEASEEWLEEKEYERQQKEEYERRRAQVPRVKKALLDLIDQGALTVVEWNESRYSYHLPGKHDVYVVDSWDLPSGWSWAAA